MPIKTHIHMHKIMNVFKGEPFAPFINSLVNNILRIAGDASISHCFSSCTSFFGDLYACS